MIVYDPPLTPDELEQIEAETKRRVAAGEYADEDTIRSRATSLFKMDRKFDPESIEGLPNLEELKKDGFKYGFLTRHEKCPKCTTEMLGRIKTYPPYCDSSYEEWSCPKCGHGYGMSV